MASPPKGKKDEPPSLYREYNRKLKHLSGRFYTEKGKEMAQKRQKCIDAWFKSLHEEIDNEYKEGEKLLSEFLEESQSMS